MAEQKSYRYKPDDTKENNQTIILIAVLLVLIVLVGGALLLVLTQKEKTDTSTSNQAPVTNQNLTNTTNLSTNQSNVCDEQCLFDRALANNSISDCQSINTTNTQQKCYEQLSNRSLDACKLVSNSTKKKKCVTSFAVALGSTLLCDLIVEGKQECKVAVDPCINSINPPLCSALRKNNPTECHSDTTCLINYSVTKKNASSCSLIQGVAASAACTSTIQYSDDCAALALKSEQDYCYQLMAIYSNNYLTCSQISLGSIYLVDCYSTFAARMQNLSICDEGDIGLNELWACYRNYSLITGNLSGCQNIDELAITNQFQCVFEYAKKYGDPSACDLIESLSSRSTCYEGSIIYSNQNLDWHHCSNVTNFIWQNKCYTEGAKITNNISICDYPSETYARESCRTSFESNKTKQ